VESFALNKKTPELPTSFL